MRLVFAGTPAFARQALAALVEAGHELALVLTQPDRPAGRGMKLQASPVKEFALSHGLHVSQPRSLRLDGKFPEDSAAARRALQEADAQAMVVAAYGLILPQWVLDQMAGGSTGYGAQRLGCINIHASLLPRWRGAAPIHRAIEAGDAQTGVTIMQMDAGLDTGAMLLASSIAIGPDETTGALQERLSALGAQLIVRALKQAAAGTLVATVQPEQGVTYAHKIERHEAWVDWSRSAQVVQRQIRALDPAPGASTTLGGTAIKLWRSEIDNSPCLSDAPCGTVLSADPGAVVVRCGTGALRLTVLQRAGGKRLPVREFLQGFTLQPGNLLGGIGSAC